MKKRCILIILVISLFIFTGCNKDEKTAITDDNFEYEIITSKEKIDYSSKRLLMGICCKRT